MMMKDSETTKFFEKTMSEYLGVPYALALNSVYASVHLALKLAAEVLYSDIYVGDGLFLQGKKVFCSDFCSSNIIDPVLYEGGEPVFIDSAIDNWGMDPEALEIAFGLYSDVKIVIASHPYGFLADIDAIKRVCEEHDAVLIEDASLSIGAKVQRCYAGSVGDYGVIGFGNESIIPGALGFCGAALLLGDRYSYEKAKFWAGGSRLHAKWEQHSEMGHEYLMSKIVSGHLEEQLDNIEEYIAGAKVFYERCVDQFDPELIQMIPIVEGTEPNYGFSCFTVESNILFEETRDDYSYTYKRRHGTAAPMLICDTLEAAGYLVSPVYKPMHLQPVFSGYEQVSLDGAMSRFRHFYQKDIIRSNESRELFLKGVCLPYDPDMTEEIQEKIIELVMDCFE